MREREDKLNEALTRLRHWLALDTEAMLSPGVPMSTGLAGLEEGAEHLRAEADANKRLATVARQSQEDAEASLSEMRDQVESLTRQVASVTAERDDLQARLEAHETLLKTAGLEIEFRPGKGKRSR